MKKTIYFLIAMITLASCTKTYRLRNLENKKVMIIEQFEVAGLKKGDTVQ